MEFFFQYFLHLVLLFLPFSFFFLVYIKKNKSPNVNLPPGSKGWPFIGENLALLIAGWKGHPEKFFNDRMRKYSPDVFQTSLLGENMAVFCGATGNKVIFTNENKLVKAWWPKSFYKSFLIDDPDEYKYKESSTKIRKLLIEFLKPEALKYYIPIMDSMTKQHFKTDWYPFKEVKVFPLIRKYTLTLACRILFRIEDPNFVSNFSAPFSLLVAGILSVPINFPGTPYYKAIRASKIIKNEILKIINQRKMEILEKKNMVSPDFLTRLILCKEDDGRPLKDIKIASQVIGLLVGGYDTISSILTFVLKYFVEHPQVYDRVFQEQMEIIKSKDSNEALNWEDIQKMKYTWCVACEILRLLPPGPGAFREVINEFTYAGFTIPKGWKLFWNVYSTHKNPKYFPNPEEFNPSRFEGTGPAPYTFVPFGGGPVMCPGKEYSRLEMLVFIHNLVTKFKWNKVIENDKITFVPFPIPVNGFPVQLNVI